MSAGKLALGVSICGALLLAAASGAGALPPLPGGYGFYETIGSGEDQITVLHVGGTHYEMGYWHGYLLQSQVQANAASAIAAAEAEGVTDEIWAWAISSMWPYVPQEYLDEMQGLADGAGLSVEEVWKVHAIPDLSEFHCSAFAAMGDATVDGHCIQLRNLDYGLDLGIQQHPLLIVYEPTGRNKYVNITFAGFCGVIAGMNYEQIPVSEMGDEFDYANETLEGEPMPFLLKEVLELAQSYSDAESIIGFANRTSSLWYTVSDPNQGQAGLMMTSPLIFEVWYLGEMPGGVLPAIEDVIYAGYYNDRLYADLSANWGAIDPEVAMAISVNNAMNSNLMNAVYDATTLEMWVAYAEGYDRAANRPFVYFNLNWPTQPVADAQAAPLTVPVGVTVNFDASGSYHPHPNHSIVTYEWDWNSDGVYDATGVSAAHAFSSGGAHTVTLRVTDDFIPGRSATDTVVINVVGPPTISAFQINGGAQVTDSLSVTLSITCAGATQMRFRNAGEGWAASWCPWLPYAASVPWTLVGTSEGSRRVDAQCKDAYGQVSEVVSDSIHYDTASVAPKGSVAIAGGAEYTSTLQVTLNLSASGAAQMRLKNRYSDAWGDWESFAATKAWTLAAGGEGVRAVYAQYRDLHGNLSPTCSDTICYDTATPPSGSVVINDGAAYTANPAVTLKLRATMAKQMRFRNEGGSWSAWKPYAATYAWTLSGGADGLRTVSAQFCDYLGNNSAVVSDSIMLDTDQPPTGRVVINSGAAFTLRRQVTLSISASGAAQMRFKNRFSDPWGEWMPYAATLAWTLAEGADGTRAVYAQFCDNYDHLSAPVGDTIFYDTFAAPVLNKFLIENGAAQTATLQVTLNLGASGAIQMRFKNAADAPWSAWRTYATTTTWTLASGTDGARTVYAQCRDYLGNESQVKSDTIILDRP